MKITYKWFTEQYKAMGIASVTGHDVTEEEVRLNVEKFGQLAIPGITRSYSKEELDKNSGVM